MASWVHAQKNKRNKVYALLGINSCFFVKGKGKEMDFFNKYVNKLSDISLCLSEKDFINAISLLENVKKNQAKVIVVGNGGSAAISSHIAVDLTKACGIRSINFNEADLITCFANDFGYENWVVEALRSYAVLGDLVILISSSGTSPNIVNAAHFCKTKGISLITLSGFEKNNPLSKLGELNIWVDSKYYNFVEMIHHIWLVALVDKIAIGDKMVS